MVVPNTGRLFFYLLQLWQFYIRTFVKTVLFCYNIGKGGNDYEEKHYR